LSPVVFNEVQNQSPLTLSGTIAGQDMQPQGTGALTTTYFGTFGTDIDMTNGLIKFIGGGNDFCAANTGNWAPLPDGSDGTAPAEYGFQVSIRNFPFHGAIRDYHMETDTGGQALALYPNADGSFGFASAQTIKINAGTGTFSFLPMLGSGPINFSGLAGPNQADDGTLIVNSNGSFHITIPISASYNTTIGGIRTTLNVNGQIVGDGAYANSAWRSGGNVTVTGVVNTSDGRIEINTLGATGTQTDGVTSEIQPGVALATTAAPAPGAPLGSTEAPVVHQALADAFDLFTTQPSDAI
jgi:hypothetical protein